MRRLILFMAIVFSGTLFAQDPYMNHSYPWYDGWWLFCGFEGNGYIEGVVMELSYAISSHPDTGRHYCEIFTNDTVYQSENRHILRDEIQTMPGWFDVRYIHNDTTYCSLRRDTTDTTRYHVHLEIPQDSVIADFEIAPRNLHSWGGNYFGTIDAPLNGEIIIKGDSFSVSGISSFEHAWGEGGPYSPDKPTHIAWWHYEVVNFYQPQRFGSMVWPYLKSNSIGGEQVDEWGATSFPDGRYHRFPREDYQLEYLEKTVIHGCNVPTKWKIIANTPEGALEYTGVARLFGPCKCYPELIGVFGIHVLADYTGTFTPDTGGMIALAGKAPLEFLSLTHDPLYHLDERTEHKFDFGNNEPQMGFKKVHFHSPYGPGGYGFAFSDLDYGSDADLTQYGNTGIHSDCAWLYHDFWYFWLDVPNGTYTVKLYWGVTDSISTQTFDIYDGKAGGGPYELEADSVGDATYPNEVTVEDIQIENEAIEIQIHRNSDIFCLISALEVMRQTGVKEEGNCQLATRVNGQAGNWQLSIHPNPATHNAVVEFVVHSWEFVDEKPLSLKIHDLSGRLVRSFNLCNLDKSVKSVVWDGTDENGRKVSGGIYFCKLRIGDFIAMKKLILLR